MDLNNLGNIRLSDFEQLGVKEYNRGFIVALETVIKILDKKPCDDYKADNLCEHDVCGYAAELAEGLMGVKNNVQ
jgi:hypothetical protein